MANKTINYESDFKIIEGFKDGSSILAAPFRFTYYTKVSRGVYVAEYNGSEFVNCIPTEDGKVIVPFDSPKLGMGVLMVKREFFLNDSNFNDGICNLVSVESTGITLDKGATDDLGEIEVLIEPYYHTVNGGGDIENGSITEIKLADNAVSTKKIKDGAVTEDKLSDEVKDKLNKAGQQGEKGEDGKSAYEIWLGQGNEGSEQDFLDSLKGYKGEQGIQGIQGDQGEKGEKGEKGDKMTYDDLTEEEKDDLASRVPAPDVDLSEYAKSADVQSAIEEVNAKIDMYKEATIDFGTGEDTVTMAIMDSGTTITKVKMKNVKTLYLSYGNVTKAEYVGGEVALGNADFLVMTIIRTASDVDAVVGLTLR